MFNLIAKRCCVRVAFTAFGRSFLLFPLKPARRNLQISFGLTIAYALLASTKRAEGRPEPFAQKLPELTAK
jgi:hypothetical protein